MKTISFAGGCTTTGLGPQNDVLAFFDCIDEFVVKANDSKYDLITDGLFRRYIPLHDLDAALDLMESIKLIFAKIGSQEFSCSRELGEQSRLSFDKPTLADVFSEFFRKFEDVVESARFFFEDWEIYQAVKIVIADIPDCMTYKMLPLTVLDTVNGEPLWLRDARGESPIGFRDGEAYIK